MEWIFFAAILIGAGHVIEGFILKNTIHKEMDYILKFIELREEYIEVQSQIINYAADVCQDLTDLFINIKTSNQKETTNE